MVFLDPVSGISSTHSYAELSYRLAAPKGSVSLSKAQPPREKVQTAPFAEKPAIFSPLADSLSAEQQKFILKAGLETRKIQAPKTERPALPQAKIPSGKTAEKPKTQEPAKIPPSVTYNKDLKSEDAPADPSTTNQVDLVA